MAIKHAHSTLYKLLNLPPLPLLSPTALTKAYDAKALELHPADQNRTPTAMAKYEDLRDAYTSFITLSHHATIEDAQDGDEEEEDEEGGRVLGIERWDLGMGLYGCRFYGVEFGVRKDIAREKTSKKKRKKKRKVRKVHVEDFENDEDVDNDISRKAARDFTKEYLKTVAEDEEMCAGNGLVVRFIPDLECIPQNNNLEIAHYCDEDALLVKQAREFGFKEREGVRMRKEKGWRKVYKDGRLSAGDWYWDVVRGKWVHRGTVRI